MDQAELLELRVQRPRSQRSSASSFGLLVRNNPIGAIGAGGIVLLVLLSLLAPLIAPFEPTAQIAKRFTEPSLTYIMGTDDVGRDVFSRLVIRTASHSGSAWSRSASPPCWASHRHDRGFLSAAWSTTS